MSVFQAQSGGRQQRDLLETYPSLQRDFDALPMTLILILDGAGIVESPRRVLARLLEQVGAGMSTEQAQQGILAEALADAVLSHGERSGRTRALGTLIDSALRDSTEISAQDLPDRQDRVLLAFGDYVASHPDKDLELNISNATLRWRSAAKVEPVQSLAREYRAADAVRSLMALLNARDEKWLAPEDDVVGAFGTIDDPVLPHRLFVAAATSSTGVVDAELVRTVGRLNRSRDVGGGVAILITPDINIALTTMRQQAAMATSVVVVDLEDLRAIATSKSPRDAVISAVLAQADLSKANPFTVMGATRQRMFYGRGAEEALLQHTLTTNSAALIGGRRIGKTSLLQHARDRLGDAGWNVLYADCQAVGSWKSFAEHVNAHWDVRVSSAFSVEAVTSLFAELGGRAPGPLVVMLDEVDALLKWDREDPHSEGMREPLFRSLRSLSQEGRAQFVFSGERLIAGVLWDPSSPHWNFCRAIPLRQLARPDAEALLTQPLAALGVRFEQPKKVLDLAWQATSGHPQIVQQLGESLVMLLNERPAESRGVLSVGDVESVVTDSTFIRHYVATYWGQATPTERLVTGLIAAGDGSVEQLARSLTDSHVAHSLEDLEAALRMLDLYGIVDVSGQNISWRATAFPAAMRAMGGAGLIVEDLARDITRHAG
ncbi:ATP-binding protein [Georgenia wangjunii]|uniref:ATP-binding protein n=1 Tax=Georgenia wangjunii TaxID=3117730 RepID=UPI002F269E30